jgi:hypothetical protein
LSKKRQFFTIFLAKNVLKIITSVPGWPNEFIKNRPKCSPARFLSQFTHNLCRGKM